MDVLYTVFAHVLLSTPILASAIAPHALGAIVIRSNDWCTRYLRLVTIAVTVQFDAYFTSRGIGGLLTCPAKPELCVNLRQKHQHLVR